jgi:hypothetical protein
MEIIIGNVIALIASLIMVGTGLVKSKKKIIFYQSIEIGLYVASNMILGGYTGAIINILSLVRNILCYKDQLGKNEKIVISILSIILSILFNNLGLIGYLPLLASLIYLWLMNIKAVTKFKILTIVIMIMWLIYDFKIKSYVSATFDFLTVITNIVGIYQLKKKKKLKH